MTTSTLRGFVPGTEQMLGSSVVVDVVVEVLVEVVVGGSSVVVAVVVEVVVVEGLGF